MPELAARDRRRLPDSAFAYIDSRGRRRLPIHDESHVRNALARFNQTAFENEAARDRARERLVKAARKYGILPIGFFEGQLRRLHGELEARTVDVRKLPTGFVTFLLTDIEGSTALLHRLGDGYSRLLAEVRGTLRTAVREAGGHEVDARADEFFAVFERPAAALEAALNAQRRLGDAAWPEGVEVRLRMGIHSGTPTLADTGYVGLCVHTAARVCSAAHGGQILLSGEAHAAMEGSQPADVRFRALGTYRLHGLPEPQVLVQAEAADVPPEFPEPRTAPPDTIQTGTY